MALSGPLEGEGVVGLSGLLLGGGGRLDGLLISPPFIDFV